MPRALSAAGTLSLFKSGYCRVQRPGSPIYRPGWRIIGNEKANAPFFFGGGEFKHFTGEALAEIKHQC